MGWLWHSFCDYVVFLVTCFCFLSLLPQLASLESKTFFFTFPELGADKCYQNNIIVKNGEEFWNIILNIMFFIEQ